MRDAAGLESPERYFELLDQAAALAGIEQEYWDTWGHRHIPSAEVKRALVRELFGSCETSAEIEAVLERSRQREWLRLTPATLVVCGDRLPIQLPVRLPVRLAGEPVYLSVELESGAWVQTVVAPVPAGKSAEFNGEGYVECEVALSEYVPFGYHRLNLRAGELESVTRLIVTPGRAYLPPALEGSGKAAGVAVSLYGVRSHRNWGCGDFTDLADLLPWLHDDLHGCFIALNPLHAIDNRQPYNISPYLPNSTFFRNPLYLDVEKVPEFAHSLAAQLVRYRAAVTAEIAALRSSEFVEYERVWRLKRFFLLLCFRQFLRGEWGTGSPRAGQFRQYLVARGERLRWFATYCALWDHIHRHHPGVWTWREWPEEFQNPESSAVADFASKHQRQILFHSYLQWLVDGQLEEAQQKAAALGLPIGLYHDMALATDRCGADLWAYQKYFVAGCRVGSPPDGFAPNGQDWAFPPPDVIRVREDGYQLFIDAIRASSRHGGALRIDHVMRLFRLFWIPEGMEAKDGAYVRDFHEDLLRVLALESVRGRFMVIGEDLGTIADYMREALARFGVLSYKVLYFEKHFDGSFRRPEEFARHAIVSSTTHDLPTLAGYWTHRDIESRKNAGLLPDEASYNRQIEERATDKQRMLDVLHSLKLLPGWFPTEQGNVADLNGELHNAILGFLVSAPSMLLVLNQEDLTKETEQQNLPASTWQYPNWRRKMTYTIEELRTLKVTQDFTAMFRNWMEKSGRSVR